MRHQLTCEFGSDHKQKGFRRRFKNENKAAAFYCASEKWRQHMVWRLCAEHWLAVGAKLADWKKAVRGD